MDDLDLVVVDGPNFYNRVADHVVSLEGGKELAAEYMLSCFDADRLLRASLGDALDPLLGIVLFHSTKALGRGPSRIGKSDRFWARQGMTSNTSTVLVEIPGDQREVHVAQCPRCDCEVSLASNSEKGVDTSITTYILETAPKWDSVCIVSSDVDFVPPVLALRRQGKRVFCASVPGTSVTALQRVCQSFVPLDLDFVRRDFEVFRLLRADGDLDLLVEDLLKWGGIGEAFAIRFRAEFRDNVIEIGFEHDEAEESAPVLQRRVLGTLRRKLSTKVTWEPRNNQVAFAYVSFEQAVGDGLVRHLDSISANARWKRHAGNFFEVAWSGRSRRDAAADEYEDEE